MTAPNKRCKMLHHFTMPSPITDPEAPITDPEAQPTLTSPNAPFDPHHLVTTRCNKRWSKPLLTATA